MYEKRTEEEAVTGREKRETSSKVSNQGRDNLLPIFHSNSLLVFHSVTETKTRREINWTIRMSDLCSEGDLR